ncbi:Rib/alpha-like domain-containing protein [Corynebacterium meridianum]|uniref:Long Rib domain-containing protein n=1 Tax=Corynebacterium meridianum TaxID=2765363 RepID=A0A934I7P3_9CORY|nr:Rib/alpha-like domain-containing protein [Corynebacterium meridianum]MBI8989985.1 hypothetical protein [Corynebacterium meridianum]
MPVTIQLEGTGTYGGPKYGSELVTVSIPEDDSDITLNAEDGTAALTWTPTADDLDKTRTVPVTFSAERRVIRVVDAVFEVRPATEVLSFDYYSAGRLIYGGSGEFGPTWTYLFYSSGLDEAGVTYRLDREKTTEGISIDVQSGRVMAEPELTEKTNEATFAVIATLPNGEEVHSEVKTLTILSIAEAIDIRYPDEVLQLDPGKSGKLEPNEEPSGYWTGDQPEKIVASYNLVDSPDERLSIDESTGVVTLDASASDDEGFVLANVEVSYVDGTKERSGAAFVVGDPPQDADQYRVNTDEVTGYTGQTVQIYEIEVEKTYGHDLQRWQILQLLESCEFHEGAEWEISNQPDKSCSGGGIEVLGNAEGDFATPATLTFKDGSKFEFE